LSLPTISLARPDGPEASPRHLLFLPRHVGGRRILGKIEANPRLSRTGEILNGRAK
jgi:hypothetical protein